MYNTSFPLFKPKKAYTRGRKVKDYLHFVNNINISIVIWPIYFILVLYIESIIYLFTLFLVCFLFLYMYIVGNVDGVYKKKNP